jgi:hypothetical protein
VYKAGYSDTSDCHVIRWFWLVKVFKPSSLSVTSCL